MSDRRLSITPTPLMDAVVAEVRRELHKPGLSYGKALQWVIEDLLWHPPDVPAYGTWSPAMASIARRVAEAVAS